jgi:hypothetical protein
LKAFEKRAQPTKKTATNCSLQNTQCFYNQINIFFGDMRLEKYTLEHRNLGQAEGAHKVGANARCSQKVISGNKRNRSKVRDLRAITLMNYGVPKNPWIFGESVSDN